MGIGETLTRFYARGMRVLRETRRLGAAGAGG
jgi:hypothetical protein